MFGYRDYYAERVAHEQREEAELDELMRRACDERDCLTETEALRLAMHLLDETAARGTAPVRGIRRAYFHGAATRRQAEAG